MMGCSPDSPQAPEVVTTTQDLRVVALGNSITAGFMNNGLVLDGQLASYPNLIYRQAVPGDLQMPFVDRPGAGADFGRSPLFVNAKGEITTEEISDPFSLLINAQYPVPYDNLAVPGATTKDILDAWNFETSEGGNLLATTISEGPWVASRRLAGTSPSSVCGKSASSGSWMLWRP
jgi:hypothetical protein